MVVNVKGLEREPEEGDLVWMNSRYDSNLTHIVIYTGNILKTFYTYYQSGALTAGVGKVRPSFLRAIWTNFQYMYVKKDHGDELDLNVKREVIGFIRELIVPRHLYQIHYTGNDEDNTGIYHADVNDNIDPNGYFFKVYNKWGPLRRIREAFKIKRVCVKRFTCAELLWAAYMDVTSEKVNIGFGTSKWDDGEISWGFGNAYNLLGPGKF